MRRFKITKIKLILKRFVEIIKSKDLRKKTRKYYKHQSFEEKEEDIEWAEFSTRQAEKIWDQE